MESKKSFNYAMCKIICNGTIKSCEFCKNIDNIQEGFCEKCGRPLWKKTGEHCGFILGYYDRNYHQNNKVHIKCKFCNTLTSI